MRRPSDVAQHSRPPAARGWRHRSAAVTARTLLLYCVLSVAGVFATPRGASAYPDGRKEIALQQKLSGRLTITGKNSRSVPATFYMAETADAAGAGSAGASPSRVLGYLLLQVDDAVLTFVTKLVRSGGSGNVKEPEYALSATQRQGWMPAAATAAHLNGTCKRDEVVGNLKCQAQLRLDGKQHDASLILFGGSESRKVSVNYPGKLTFDAKPQAQKDAELVLVRDQNTRMHGILLIDTERKTHVFDSTFHIVKRAQRHSLAGTTLGGRELRAECRKNDDGTTICKGALYDGAQRRPLNIVFYGVE